MTSDMELGQLLVRQSLMSEAQLATALEFQKSLGGDLRNIVVKLGYVKDSVLADLVAQEEHVEASAEITESVIEFNALKSISRDVLEKHFVIPLKSEDPHTLVLAMADPNDLRAIEEIQFLVNKSVEPAVTTKAAIRKALNQLPEMLKRRGGKQKKKRSSLPPEVQRALRDTPVDKLIRAYLAVQIERGELSAEDLLARANKL